jgi:hypothetical protein
MQFPIRVLAVTGADESEAMMIGVATQKHHAAGHHLFRVNVRDFEAQDLRVKFRGAFEIGYLQDDVADFADMKIHALLGRHAFQLFDIDGHNDFSISESAPQR